MKLSTRLIASVLAGALVLPPAFAQQQPKTLPQPAQAQAQSEAKDEQPEPKFIWGILINIAISKLSNYVFQVFTDWLTARLTAGLDSAADAAIAHLTRDSGAKISSRGATPVLAVAGAAQPAPIVVGNPDKPLVADGKKENYQGVHVALMMSEDGGRRFAFRPVNEGFRTGERFKLRVVSTFGGELSIENINPRGERRQVFPPRADQVVALLPATETLIPMDPNQFFEFTGSTGREQLVINVADPRAVGAAASRSKIFRQDTKFGSNFLQEATGGTYPSIQQAVELVHGK